MPQDQVRLLEHLCYDHFGPAVGLTASLLLTRGTLSFKQLGLLSSLPRTTLAASLLVLSLHSCLHHGEAEVGGRPVELFEIDVGRTECRMRIGSYIVQAEEWGARLKLPAGMHAALGIAIEAIWERGFVRARELEEVVGARVWQAVQAAQREEEHAAANGVQQQQPKKKGKGRAKITSLEEAEEAAAKLLRRAFYDGFISIVTPGSQLSPSSLEIKWDDELRLSIKGIPSAKELKEVKMMLKQKKEDWDEEELERARGREPASDDVGGPRRKKRRVAALEMDSEQNYPELPRNSFFRINSERFHIRWRSGILKSYCAERYSPAMAELYAVILALVDGDNERMADSSSRDFSFNELSTALASHSINFDSIFPPAAPGGWSRAEAGPLALEACKVLAGADQAGFGAVPTLLEQSGEGASAKWHVPWRRLCGGVKRALVERIIRDKLGPEAVRCWRILDAKGKLEEKHLARLAFLSVKDAREVIGRLSASGFIEAQEVPRSADRAPSRTFYLWGVHYAAVIDSLVAHHYKALANLQAQKKHQLDQRRGLVEKRERTDVRQDPDKLLTKRDKDGIDELDKVLEALTVAEMRLDEDLFVLKEFDP